MASSEEEFLHNLEQFYASRGETLRIPQIGGNQLDAYTLYKEVTTRGGFQQVSNSKLWKEIVQVLAIPSSCTSASYTLRHHYYKILLLFEQHNFFGKSSVIPPDVDKPTKKIKLTAPIISNTRRLMLAFDSASDDDVMWALNTLLLFSCNTARNYTFKTNNLLEKIMIYMKNNPDKVEYIRTITLILRNLSMIRMNEIPMFKVALDGIVNVFLQYDDREIKRNCLEIITNLSKHIFLKDLGETCTGFLTSLLDCLFTADLAEQTLECFRRLSLPIGNEEVLETLPDCFYEVLGKSLIIKSSYEASLELLLTLSDQKLSTRGKMAPYCIETLVRMLSSTNQVEDQDDKIAKISALILNNIIAAPATVPIFRKYERDIMLVAASDERLTPFLTPILLEINSS